MKIVLQFSTSKDGFVSSAIRWLTWSDYSHVDLVLPNGKLLGARADGGVQIREPDYLGKDCKRVRHAYQGAQKVIDYELTQVGKAYDQRAIMGILLRRNWRDESKWFCSELQQAASEIANCPLVNPWTRISWVSPSDLLKSPILTRTTIDDVSEGTI